MSWLAKFLRTERYPEPQAQSKSPELDQNWPSAGQSFLQTLAGKVFNKAVIITQDEDILGVLAQVIRAQGGNIVEERLIADVTQPIQLSNLDQAEHIILAVFDPSVYQLRARILEQLKNKEASPEIIAPAYPYQPLTEDNRFNQIVENLAVKTEWDTNFWRSWKSYGVYQLLRLALRHPGDCFEFGCYRGYSAAFLAETMDVFAIRDKKIVLFDTWQGMPSSNKAADNFYRTGDFADTALTAIQQTLAPWVDRFEYVQGDICQTLPVQKPRPLCYARVDVDLYEPARVAFEITYDWVVEGGIVYFDDYVSEKTVGERLAVDEILANRPERPFYMLGDRAYIIKGVQ